MEPLIETVEVLVDILERLGLEYALGGAIAATYWGTIRTTQDADCLVNLPALRYQEFVDEVTSSGFVGRDAAGNERRLTVKDLREQEQRLRFVEFFRNGLRVQCFTPFVALQREILARAVQMPFGNRTVRVSTAEDMVLLKMAFHRQKDIHDVRGILLVQRGKLDLAYIRRWGHSMLSSDANQELERYIQESSQAAM